MAAAMYIACRAIGVPRTLGDIATIINIKPKELASTYRLLVLELGLKIPMSDPIKCIASIANKVNLSEKTKRQAINIMRHIISKKQEVTAGKHPMALAAAILYLLSIDMGENITQNSIAQAAGITQVTVRNRCKDVKPVILEHNF
jgi:transcription initiation factor TFIIB